jgi:thiamine kinase-like enzyme
LSEPPIVIHGELYPANVLVRGDDVRFVDWESAGRGPAVVDIAAVTTGWDEPTLAAFLHEYGDVDLLALESARFHLAVRWLGWSADWAPPAEHRRDWLAEAYRAAA